MFEIKTVIVKFLKIGKADNFFESSVVLVKFASTTLIIHVPSYLDFKRLDDGQPLVEMVKDCFITFEWHDNQWDFITAFS